MKYSRFPELEAISRDELLSLQSKRLVKLVKRAYENVAPYRTKMESVGLLPGDIKSTEDLPKLPFTTKQDLRDNYPFGLFAVPQHDIVRIHASSGTTGKQTVVGYTQNDINAWSEIVARGLTAVGVDKDSVVQVCFGYGLFTGGLGLHDGAQRVGAAVVPASVGNTSRQITLMRDFKTSVLCCTPSYALYLAETMEDMGITQGDLSLKTGIFGAEPWTENMRSEIESRLGIDAHDIYGLSEIMGPGVAMDCEAKSGMHIWEDHFIPEIVNPDTGKQEPGGVNGELVFTTLTKEGLPLIRYRTHDVSRLNYSKCECGRTMVRMDKPSGRTDDMLIIRGVNVFPSQIESALLECGAASPHFLITVDREGLLDTVEIKVEMSDDLFSDEVRGVEDATRTIKSKLESTLGIATKIKLVEPKSLERFEGKSKNVIDHRNLK